MCVDFVACSVLMHFIVVVAQKRALRKKKMKFIIIIACFDINKAKKDVNMWEKGNYYYCCLRLRCVFCVLGV